MPLGHSRRLRGARWGGVKEADTAKNWMEERRAGFKPPVPNYALDCHTARGRQAGKTDLDWWRDDAWLPPGGYGRYDWYASLKKWGGNLPEGASGRAGV